MKKIITLLCTIFCVLSVFAQDIIITKDSKRIEAKILEVSSTEVKYKKTTNIDGPTFVELVSNISAIVYSNGEVESFNVEIKKEENIEIEDLSLENHLPEIAKVGQNLFMTSNNEQMSSAEFKSYLEKNCLSAYNVWVNGEVLRKTGWACLGMGVSLDIISIIIAYRSQNIVASYYTGVIGGLFEIACIPTLIVGYNRKQKAVNYYNSLCTKKNPNITLNFGVAPNQVGCILSF